MSGGLTDWRAHTTELRGTIALLGGSVVASGLGFVCLLIGGRLLDAAEYADFVAAIAITYFTSTALGPLSQTVAFFVAQRRASGAGEADVGTLERGFLRATLRWSAAISLCLVAAVPFVSGALNFRSPSTLCMLVATMFIFARLAVVRGSLQGEQRFTLYTINLLAEAMLRALVVLVLLLRFHNGLAGIAGYFVAALAGIAIAPRRKGAASDAIDLSAARTFLMPVFLSTLIFAAFQSNDVLIAKHFFSAYQAGIYGAAVFVGRGAGMLLVPFYVAAVPQLASVAAKGEPIRVKFVRMLLHYAVLSSAALVVSALAAPWLVQVLLGPAFAPAAPLLLPLSASILIGNFGFLLCQLPAARKDFRFLRGYAIGLGLQWIAVACWHASAMRLVSAMIATHLITIVLVVPSVRRAARIPVRDPEPGSR